MNKKDLNIGNLEMDDDEDIDYSDIPELDDEWFKNAKWVHPKQSVTIRLDNEVVNFFRKQGNGYQTKINAVLRSYVKAQE